MTTVLTRIEITEEIREFVSHYTQELGNTDYLSHLTPHMTKLYERVVSFIRAEKNWLVIQSRKQSSWAKFDEDDDATAEEVFWALYLSRVMKRVQAEMVVVRREMSWEFRARFEDTWRRSYDWMNERYGGNLSFGPSEISTLERLGRERVEPALKNNMDRITRNIEKAGKTAMKPDRFIERVGFLHPKSHDYQGGWLSRLCYTEKHEHITESQITGMEKLGENRFRRLVTADDVTSIDLCLPFADVVYSGRSAHGIVPAHPFCRCMMVPFIETIFVEDVPRPVVL